MILSTASAPLMRRFLEVVYACDLSLTDSDVSFDLPLSNGHATITIPVHGKQFVSGKGRQSAKFWNIVVQMDRK